MAKLEVENKIYEKITSFYNKTKEDGNHRYKSWEHCYQYFSNKNIDIDIASLHLAFYLASWGMYRGSSHLLWKDYKIHQEVVKKLIEHKGLRDINFKSITEQEIKDIIELADCIRDWYGTNIEIKEENGEDKKFNATDTLVTKIMLGVLGCTPAYDRYFISGMRKSDIPYSKSHKKNLFSVVQFYQKNYEQFKKAGDYINSKSVVDYPAMKLVDMYFWQIGFENEKTKN